MKTSAASTPRFIIADTERDADLLYVTRFMVGDPIIYLEEGRKRTILLSDLEIDRGRREAEVDEILSLSEFEKAHEDVLGKNPKLAATACVWLATRKIKRVTVPESFPLGVARQLEDAGVKVEVASGAFYPERVAKTEEEQKCLRRAMQITEDGMARAHEVLTNSDIGKSNKLTWAGQILSSERLRAEIDSAVLRAGGLPTHTIVAGGNQACDPHERGHGPLRANDMIIVDIFPRDAKSGYFGDMTRTFVRGHASEAQQRLYDTVVKGQKLAVDAVKPGGDGAAAHEAVKKFFEAQGYRTEKNADGRWTGFFHGTGHGIGLEIHEAPRYQNCKFVVGQITTVEPGLYYPGLGGVRIEDVVAVTEKGNRLVSKFDKKLVV